MQYHSATSAIIPFSYQCDPNQILLPAAIFYQFYITSYLSPALYYQLQNTSSGIYYIILNYPIDTSGIPESSRPIIDTILIPGRVRHHFAKCTNSIGLTDNTVEQQWQLKSASQDIGIRLWFSYSVLFPSWVSIVSLNFGNAFCWCCSTFCQSKVYKVHGCRDDASHCHGDKCRLAVS